MRILHLDDNAGDSLFVERGVQRQGIDASFIRARNQNDFSAALKDGGFDVVLVDNGLPGFSSRDAIMQSRAAFPDVPVIVCSGAARDADVAASFAAGASDYVLKDYSWQLGAALRRGRQIQPRRVVDKSEAMMLLLDVVQRLSLARGVDAIVDIVRRAARQLTGADGATFVLRDNDKCYYVDEDAISPLWKGQKFPLEACISGWAMLNAKSTIVPDIYKDPRIPHAAYRPTFVKSLAMVPIRTSAPIGAIGNYWATEHECTPDELMLLEALANTTSVAMENAHVYQNLESQVRERTRELQSVNQELEAFTGAVSHDLRAPLRAINAEIDVALDTKEALPNASVEKVRESTERMAGLIDDLLRLSRIGRAELELHAVDLSEMAVSIVNRLRTSEPHRRVELLAEPTDTANADPGLINVVLENLLANAWKYSGKRGAARIEFTCNTDMSGRRVFCVSDNGAGFDPMYASHLFKPFTRLHDASEFPGIGIGLATAQRIVQRHGGEIWATSDGANGAQFYFTLAPATN
jgi:signal transduction histidine kinase/CheY-like chemotaxis protein